MTTLYNPSIERNKVFLDLSSVRYDPESFFVEANYSLTPLPTSAIHGNQESARGNFLSSGVGSEVVTAIIHSVVSGL